MASLPAFAVQPDEILPDAKLEQRARKISADLRCLVCQNQSIDDSDASLAKDLRILVREHLKAGESDRPFGNFWSRATAISSCSSRLSPGTPGCCG